MALGFGSLGKKPSKDKKSSDKPAKTPPKQQTKDNSDAADILKKMDEKSAAGDCPFC